MIPAYLLPGIAMNNTNAARERATASYSIQDLMARLQVGRSTVYKLIEEGKLPRGGKGAKKRAFPKDQVHALDRKFRPWLFSADDCSETPEQAAQWDARHKEYMAAKKEGAQQRPARRARKS